MPDNRLEQVLRSANEQGLIPKVNRPENIISNVYNMNRENSNLGAVTGAVAAAALLYAALRGAKLKTPEKKTLTDRLRSINPWLLAGGSAGLGVGGVKAYDSLFNKDESNMYY